MSTQAFKLLEKSKYYFKCCISQSCTAAAAAEATAQAPPSFRSSLLAATSLARTARFMAPTGRSSGPPHYYTKVDYFSEGALSRRQPGESWAQLRKRLKEQMPWRWYKSGGQLWFKMPKAGNTGGGRDSQRGWHSEKNKGKKRSGCETCRSVC